MQICHRVIQHADFPATSLQAGTEKYSVVRIYAMITSFLDLQLVLPMQLNFFLKPLFLNLLVFEITYFISESNEVHVQANSKKSGRSIQNASFQTRRTSRTRPGWGTGLQLPYGTRSLHLQFGCTSPGLHTKQFWNLTGTEGRRSDAQQIECETIFI